MNVCVAIGMAELRRAVIKPCLITLGDYSCHAENLLTGTAALESMQAARYHPTHRGLGIYRITPERHRTIWDEYLINFPELASCVRGLASQQQFFRDPHGELTSNLNYATAIAWMIYRAAAIDISALANLNGSGQANNLAQLWTAHFDNGTGSVRNADEFAKRYRECVPSTECPRLVA